VQAYITTLGGKMATSVDAKLLKSTKFPVEFNQKVDMQKVNLEVLKK
jgi:serine/arginine repetitive matrix protein 1